MGVFGAFFGRKGVVGFSGPVLGVSSGVVGFIVAMFLRPVRDICRPARPDVGASAKEFTLCRSWMQRRALQAGCRWGFCTIRSSLAACRGSNDAIPPLRGGGAAVRGGVVAKVQTHWVKNAENRLFEVNGSALWRMWWVWTHRLRYLALQVRWMRVGSCSWAPLLAPVTRYIAR